MYFKSSLLISILIILLISACKQADHFVPQIYKPKNAHEAYSKAILDAGLGKSALGHDWIEASKKAMQLPREIKAPYEEEFFVLLSEVSASAYKVSSLRGQKIEIEIEQIAGDSMKTFLDAFEIPKDSLASPKLIASLDPKSKKLGFEVIRDAEFII